MKCWLGLAAILAGISGAAAQPANTQVQGCLSIISPTPVADNQYVTRRCDTSGNAYVSIVGTPTVNDTSVPSTGTGGVSAVTVGVASAQASAAAVRTFRLSIQNVSATASIACSLGGTAALNTAGSFQIGPGQMLTFGDPVYIPADALNCIASAASTPATVFSK